MRATWQRQQRGTRHSANCSHSSMSRAWAVPGNAYVRSRCCGGGSAPAQTREQPTGNDAQGGRSRPTARLLRPLLGAFVFVGGQMAEVPVTDPVEVVSAQSMMSTWCSPSVHVMHSIRSRCDRYRCVPQPMHDKRRSSSMLVQSHVRVARNLPFNCVSR